MLRLDCPRCHRELNRTPLGCLCSDCDGCWFGFDQFDKVLRLSDLQLEASDIEPTLHSDNPDVPLEQPVACPRCQTRMKRHTYHLDSGVLIDTCREHGMWLDDGELSKIRAYLQALEIPTHDPPPRLNFFRRLLGG